MSKVLNFNYINNVDNYKGIVMHPDTGELVAAFSEPDPDNPFAEKMTMYASAETLKNIIKSLDDSLTSLMNEKDIYSRQMQKICHAIVTYQQSLRDIVRSTSIIKAHKMAEKRQMAAKGKGRDAEKNKFLSQRERERVRA